jgi:hypothetical protein
MLKPRGISHTYVGLFRRSHTRPAIMPNSRKSISRDYRDFRFRLRHDHFLRRRLRRAKQEATIALARELGFILTIDDLQGPKKRERKAASP